MEPKHRELIVLLHGHWIGLQYSLEYFRNVSQVECVVEFGRNGQQVLRNLSVEFNSGPNSNIRLVAPNSLIEYALT